MSQHFKDPTTPPFSEIISALQVEKYINIGLGGRDVAVFHDNTGAGAETTEEGRLLEDKRESRCQVVRIGMR